MYIAVYGRWNVIHSSVREAALCIVVYGKGSICTVVYANELYVSVSTGGDTLD